MLMVMVYELHVLEMLVQLQDDLLLVEQEVQQGDLLLVERPHDEQEVQQDDLLHEVINQAVLQRVVQVHEMQMVIE